MMSNRDVLRLLMSAALLTCAADLTSANCGPEVNGVAVTPSGFRYDRSSQLFIQQVTVIKNSGGSITGPVLLVVDNLPASVTLLADSYTSCTTLPGRPLVQIDAGLTQGVPATVTLRYNNPTSVPLQPVLKVWLPPTIQPEPEIELIHQPGNLVLNQPISMRFSLSIPSRLRPSANSLVIRIERLGTQGQVLETFPMLDTGANGDQKAGDGVYTFVRSIQASTFQPQNYRAVLVAATETLTADVRAIYVGEGWTTNTITAGQSLLQKGFDYARTFAGTPVQRADSTLAFLKLQAGVASVRLDSAKTAVTVEMFSGLRLIVPLTYPFLGGTLQPVVARQASVELASERMAAQTPDAGVSAALPVQPFDNADMTNGNISLYRPFAGPGKDFSAVTLKPDIDAILNSWHSTNQNCRRDLSIANDFTDAAANLGVLSQMAGSGILIFETHGSILTLAGKELTVLATGISGTAPNPQELAALYAANQSLIALEVVGPNLYYYKFSSDFVRSVLSGTPLQNALVIIHACLAGKKTDMAAAFRKAGAAVVVAFDDVVPIDNASTPTRAKLVNAITKFFLDPKERLFTTALFPEPCSTYTYTPAVGPATSVTSCTKPFIYNPLERPETHIEKIERLPTQYAPVDALPANTTPRGGPYDIKITGKFLKPITTFASENGTTITTKNLKLTERKPQQDSTVRDEVQMELFSTGVNVGANPVLSGIQLVASGPMCSINLANTDLTPTQANWNLATGPLITQKSIKVTSGLTQLWENEPVTIPVEQIVTNNGNLSFIEFQAKDFSGQITYADAPARDYEFRWTFDVTTTPVRDQVCFIFFCFPVSTNYEIRATVTDSSGQQVQGSIFLPIVPRPTP